jgi:hypothetical protein
MIILNHLSPFFESAEAVPIRGAAFVRKNAPPEIGAGEA